MKRRILFIILCFFAANSARAMEQNAPEQSIGLKKVAIVVGVGFFVGIAKVALAPVEAPVLVTYAAHPCLPEPDNYPYAEYLEATVCSHYALAATQCNKATLGFINVQDAPMGNNFSGENITDIIPSKLVSGYACTEYACNAQEAKEGNIKCGFCRRK